MLKQQFRNVRKADKRIGSAKIKVYCGITIHDQDPPRNFRLSDLHTEETPQEKINEAS